MDPLSNLKKILAQEQPLLQGRSYLNYDKGKSFRKSKAAFNICVVYANTYDIGMSNLGFHVVCEEFNKLHNVQVDRAFMQKRSNEEVLGCVTGRKLSDFDMIVFSIPYELDYLNIATVLKAGGVEPLREKRQTIVACGGIAPTVNPYAVAEYMDLIFIGDAEILVPQFYAGLKSADYDFDAFKKNISSSGESGFYFPDLNNKFKIQKINSMTKPFFSTVISPNTSFSNTVLVDAGRGCVYSCKFCVTGNYLKPSIGINADTFLEVVEYCSKYSVKKYGIISSCIGKIPGFVEFLKKMIEKKIEINVSSLRFEDLDDELIELLYKAGQNVFTLAPEVGRDSFRFSIGKPIKNELIVSVIEKVLLIGAKVKLYFMIGLPDESDEELVAIADLVGLFKKYGQNVKANIQAFVPKPHTVFAEVGFVGEEEIKRRFFVVKSRAEELGVNRGVFTYSSAKEAGEEYRLSWKGMD